MNKSFFTRVYNITWPNLKQVTETCPPYVLRNWYTLNYADEV